MLEECGPPLVFRIPNQGDMRAGEIFLKMKGPVPTGRTPNLSPDAAAALGEPIPE
jgi:hypothetical protein